MPTLQDIKRILNCADNPTRNYLRGATFSGTQANVDIRIGNVLQGGKQINSSQKYQDYVTVAVYSWRKYDVNSFQPLGPWFRFQLQDRKIDFVITQSNPDSHEGIVAYKSFTGDWSDDNSPVCQDLRNYISVLREILGSDTSVNQLNEYNSKNKETINDYIRRRFQHNMANENPNAETTNRSDSTKADMNTEIQTLLKSNLQIILTGAPGTGKTYTAKKVAETIVTEGISSDDVDARKKAMDERFQSVQFHPGYDYSDFVIGMKPEIVDGVNGSKAVSFDWHDGIFKTFADAARKAYDEAEDKARAPKFVFLIDEINRSDLSRVFGELFSLLEEEYRYPNNKKGVMLPNGKAFVIPRNLFIIGTMNDIDRSVESMDFALRRRFAWKEVRAKDTQKDIFDAKKPDGSAKIDPVDAEKLKKAMDALNFEIAGEEVDGKKPTLDLRLGPEYELGGAIFAKFEKCGDFKDLWRNHIEIILNEYLRGRKEKNALLTSLNGLFFESVGMAATQTAEVTGEP